jgi:hypothetical protein
MPFSPQDRRDLWPILAIVLGGFLFGLVLLVYLIATDV